jgi:hypothetical protein
MAPPRHYDQHHDPGLGVLKGVLRDHPQAFEFVKSAQLGYDPATLPDSAFAWEDSRLYPVHNEKDAAISWLYAKDDARVPDPVKTAIKEALEAFSVPPQLFDRAQEKRASAEDCLYPETGLYPVRNANEVKYAEARLLRNVRHLDVHERVRVFTELEKRASVHGVTLLPESSRYSGKTVTDIDTLVDSISARAAATKVAGMSEKYEGLATAVHKDWRALNNQDARVKLAVLLTELDKEANVLAYYDRGLRDPMATVFNTTKVASADMSMSPEKLAAMPLSFFADALGNDIIRDISTNGKMDGSVDGHKAAAVIATLPADLHQTIRCYLPK